jgi:hypothetical protein
MANRFWISGGNGNWSSTTNWSATSGGASGASVPGSSDAALFDALSGSGTATLDISPDIQRLTMTGFSGTLAFGTNKISLNSTGGIFTGSTTCTITGTPVLDATNNTSTARTVAAGAVTEGNSISLNVTAGTGNITLTGNVRDLNFTGFSGNLAGGARTVYGNLTISSAMATAATTSNTTFAATSGAKTITTNGNALNFAVTFNAPGATYNFADAITLASTRVFTFTAGDVRLKNGVTSTVGSFVAPNSAQKSLRSTVSGSQATLSQASGTVNARNLTIKDIRAVGGATFNAFTNRGNIDDGNNDGWNFLSVPFPVFGSIFRLIFKPVIQ